VPRVIGRFARDPCGCSTVVDGPVNADVFTAFVEQVLCPALRPGDIVVLDNLGSHRGDKVRRLIEQRGARVMLSPPCSPDFNPIEMVFSKIKQALRSLACRTKDALWNAMQSVLDLVTPSDATNCFRHCGCTLHNDCNRFNRCAPTSSSPLALNRRASPWHNVLGGGAWFGGV